MPSGELRRVLINCYATVGVVSNSDHSLESAGKAGRNRWKGVRPRTRAVAMNPVDRQWAVVKVEHLVVIHVVVKVNMQKVKLHVLVAKGLIK